MGTTPSAAGFTQQDIDRLNHLRALLVAFQKNISKLAADEQNSPHNEEFNRVRFETKSLLKDSGFDKNVPKAVTSEVLAERSTKSVKRFFSIVTLGTVLALIGLGINSIILEDVIINSVACVVSLAGIILIFAAFGVSGFTGRRNITDIGDLYTLGDALLQQMDQGLRKVVPDFDQRPKADLPDTPSARTMAVDSLNKQLSDWETKLQGLQNQQQQLGVDAPLELAVNADFIRQEIKRIQYEIAALGGQVTPLALPPPAATPVAPAPSVQVVERARSNTMDMPKPVVRRDREKTPESGMIIDSADLPPAVGHKPAPEKPATAPMSDRDAESGSDDSGPDNSAADSTE
ncbi:MAG: hypothetical protein AAF485_23640 [Chloroflexota bacterium]